MASVSQSAIMTLTLWKIVLKKIGTSLPTIAITVLKEENLLFHKEIQTSNSFCDALTIL